MDVSPTTAADRKALRLAMTLSLVIGLLMFVIKVGAYLLTGSAAILSDAAESVVHVAAVIFAAYSLRLSQQPADKTHLYGQARIAFFSAGFEGAMIVLAAIFIVYESIHKWRTGLSIENLGFGTALTGAAAAINAALGAYLRWLGRRKHSLILEANGKHVLTDFWTSVAVLVGLGLVLVTKWLPFDPICGMLMAGNILFAGFGLMRSAFAGLMDRADPVVHAKLVESLDAETKRRGITYHELRHRYLGDTHWVDVHLVFPPGIALTDAHRQATEVEQVIERSLGRLARLTTHLECASDHDLMHPGEPSVAGRGAAKPA